MACLRAQGIGFFGAGTIAENCNNPLVLDVGSRRIGLLGYVCPSTSPVWRKVTGLGWSLPELRGSRGIWLKPGNRVRFSFVVSLHWGAEQVRVPKPADVLLAREIIDHGADLIIGHHAHCIQSFERHKGHFIFYGLGNCVFPSFELDTHFDHQGRPKVRTQGKWYRWNNESLMVTVDLGTAGIAIRRLYFKDETKLIEKGGNIGRYASKASSLVAAGSRYSRARKYSLLRSAFASFCSKPRLPRLATIKGLLCQM